MKRILVVAALMLSSACSFSANDLTKALDIAEIGVDTLVGLFGQAGKIPVAEQPVIANWAATAADAISFAATEITSSDTTVQKIQKIDAQFAPILTSLDPAAQPWIALAQADLQAFLKILTPPSTVVQPNGKVMSHGVEVKAHISLPLLKGKFKEIKTKAEDTATKARKFLPGGTSVSYTNPPGMPAGGLNGAGCPPNTGCRSVVAK